MTNVSVVPVVSEKAFATAEAGTYVFSVPTSLSKVEVRRAVESAFGVKVRDVRTVRVKGKEIRSRTRKNSITGRRAETKKAYVKLAPGESIKIFEE